MVRSFVPAYCCVFRSRRCLFDPVVRRRRKLAASGLDASAIADGAAARGGAARGGAARGGAARGRDAAGSGRAVLLGWANHRL